MASARRVLLCSSDFPTWDGGVAVMAEKLAFHLHQAGCETNVVTPLQTETDLAFDQRQPYRIRRVPNIKDRYLKYFLNAFRVRRIIREFAPDLVICTTWHPFGSIAFSLPASIPFVLLANGNDFLEPRWRKPFWNRRMKNIFARANRVMPCSRAAMEELVKVIPEVAPRCEVLYPGLDAEDFRVTDLPFNPPVLLTVGRVVARKGQDMVLRAVPKVLREFPETQYWIGGRGSYVEELRKIAADLGISGNIRFLGFLSDAEKKRAYEECTVYLMPSRTIASSGDFEGFGITFLEAAACGKPAIGSRSAGVIEAIADAETGFLADPESPEEIADMILRLLRKPDLARSLGRAGRTRVETQFRWQTRAEQVLRATIGTGSR